VVSLTLLSTDAREKPCIPRCGGAGYCIGGKAAALHRVRTLLRQNSFRRRVPRNVALTIGARLWRVNGIPELGLGMPLKLSLRPGEKFVVNGAVVQNGDRRAALVLQNKASVLREKDIMQPEDASTPARRIYFPIMLMYLDEQGRDKAYSEFASRLAEFMGAVRDPAVLAECIGVSKEVMACEYYRALMRCRKLIAYEAERLGIVDVDKSISARGHAG
jgi:flagellar protein FlbT